MNDTTQDIFGSVEDTDAPTTQADPTRQLYHLPDAVSWFKTKDVFGKPKEARDCTATLVARFVSWQIQAETAAVYAGTGNATPGVLRNQLVSRFHQIPDGYGDDEGHSRRVPCMLEFGESCAWCAQKKIAENRFPTREQQPKDYFKYVIAPFKPKGKIVMMFEIWKQQADGTWATDGKLHAFEFVNFMKTGVTFKQIIDTRANDADRRIRIDKKTYAGYVTPVALKVTWTFPSKDGKPDGSKYAGWMPTDATPFPPEAGGPDVSKFSKEWAAGVAKIDPASWINRKAFPKIDPADVGQHVYDVFTGKKSLAPKVDLDTADFGQLLQVVEANKAKFPDLDTSDFDYSMTEPLRAIVKGVLNG